MDNSLHGFVSEIKALPTYIINNTSFIIEYMPPGTYWSFQNTVIQQNNTNLYIGGTVSGFLAGLVGTGGAIRGITLAAFQLPKEVFLATSALIDLGVDSSRAAIYVGNGYFRNEYIFLIPFLIGISILGSYLGKLILIKTSERIFRYIVLGVIIITALFQVITVMNK
jgi:uncharacterized membrane protein YfcA